MRPGYDSFTSFTEFLVPGFYRPRKMFRQISSSLGRDVRKPINANLRLKVNRCSFHLAVRSSPVAV